MNFENTITSLEELIELHGEVSLAARHKQHSSLDAHCQEFIAASPMLMLSTSSATGLCDVTPRGDAPGFVRVLSANTLAIPERNGNNRLDSARNILENPQVGLIFLIPGVLETLRVNGRARLVQDKSLLESFAVNGKSRNLQSWLTPKRFIFSAARLLNALTCGSPRVGMLPRP